MCSHYALADRTSYAFDEIPDVRLERNGKPRYNIAHSQRAPVIRLEHGLPVITELRWGLVPSWAKDEKIA